MPLTWDSLLEDEHEYTEELIGLFWSVRSEILTRLDAAGSSQKESFDRRVEKLDFVLEPGMRVWRK